MQRHTNEAELNAFRQRLDADLQTYAVIVAEQSVPYDAALAGLIVGHALPFLRRYPKFDLLDLEGRIGDRLTDAAMAHTLSSDRSPHRSCEVPR